MRALFIIIFLCNSIFSWGQEDRFYIRTIDEQIEIPVTTTDSIVTYQGTHQKLKELFQNHQVKVFRKGFKYAERDKLKRTYFVIAENSNFQKALLEQVPEIFEFGESLQQETLKIYEPNDYGTTSTIGENKGLQVKSRLFGFFRSS